MRIGNINSVGSTQSTKKKKSATENGGFDMLMNKSEESTPPSQEVGISPISSLGSLLAAQEVGNIFTTEEKQQIEHGKTLLDILEQLRIDMLTSKISVNNVQKIIQQIKSKNNDSEKNDKLIAIINEIETRAEVELAKIELANLR